MQGALRADQKLSVAHASAAGVSLESASRMSMLVPPSLLLQGGALALIGARARIAANESKRTAAVADDVAASPEPPSPRAPEPPSPSRQPVPHCHPGPPGQEPGGSSYVRYVGRVWLAAGTRGGVDEADVGRCKISR